MSESVRTTGLSSSGGYGLFPVSAASPTDTPPVSAPRGFVALVLSRLFYWMKACAGQWLSRMLRPVAALISFLDSKFRAGGQRLWTSMYSLRALLVSAASGLHVGYLKSSRQGGRVWHDLALTLSRTLFKRVTLVFLFAGACLCLIVTSFYTLGIEVILNGRSIGFVASTEQFDRAVDNVSQRASEILHYPYYPNPDVAYQFSVVDKKSVFNQAEVEEQLFGQISDIKKLHVLIVDDVAVAAAPEREGLDAILNELLRAHDPSGQAQSVRFVQDVKISYEWADAALERPLDEVAARLSSTRSARYDEVGVDDTFAGIALRNGMSASDLQALNKAVKPGQLVPEEKLLVQKPLPFLSVETRHRMYYEEPIAYTTTSVSDETIYEGDSEVRVKGVDGVARVAADRRVIDGEEQGRVEVGRETIVQPVQEVIAQGTKERPPKAPTGKFIRPYWGRVTSEFGYRSLFGGSMHEGIDFAGPIGSPIVASDGGTVTFSGTKNGYGLCVMIDHGNGIVTLYGHCSKLLVKEGQAVAKGETIAKLGNTGRSTGPHVHFETRVNGTQVDPWRYID